MHPPRLEFFNNDVIIAISTEFIYIAYNISYDAFNIAAQFQYRLFLRGHSSIELT